MRRIVRKTIFTLFMTIVVLLLAFVAAITWFSWTMGSVQGYTLGRTRAAIDDPFRAHVESGKPFVYDDGVIYPAQLVRGKRAPYYVIHPK